MGLSIPAGERDHSVLEQLLARPTLEVNGFMGGYTGPGTKNVIPSEASAKFSFRLVPGQNPNAVIDGLHRFIAERLPADVSVSYRAEGGSPALGFDTHAPAFRQRHMRWKPNGIRRRRSSAAVRRFPLWNRSAHGSAWMHFSSALLWRTTASIRPTKSTISAVSKRAREAGPVFSARLDRTMPLKQKAVATLSILAGLLCISSASVYPASARADDMNRPRAFRHAAPGNIDYYTLVLS